METYTNDDRTEDYSYINDSSLTPEERYELALMAAMDQAHVTEDQLAGYETVAKSHRPPMADIGRLVAEAVQTGRVQWGVGIIAVSSERLRPSNFMQAHQWPARTRGDHRLAA